MNYSYFQPISFNFSGIATQIQCPLGGQVQKAQLRRVRHEVLLAIRAQKPPVGPQSGSEIEQVSPLAHTVV